MRPSTGLEGGVKILSDRVDNDAAEDSGKKLRSISLVGFLFDGSLPL
jgi:hypothetical protein